VSAANSSRVGDWCQTYTGRMFWPLDPRADEVCIEDIAHALSLLCRFGGHCREFYGVAEHCVRVSEACDPADALWGLLHDASEAYLVDVPRPIKGWLGNYRAIEAGVQRAVCVRFGLTIEEPESVEWADSVLLHTEARDLMSRPPNSWKHMAPPLPGVIVPWSAPVAERAFFARFLALTEKAGAT
jgi:hypothetical protein